MESYVVFDLETTTNIPTVAEIIEIAALKIVDGCITEEFSTLVAILAIYNCKIRRLFE